MDFQSLGVAVLRISAGLFGAIVFGISLVTIILFNVIPYFIESNEELRRERKRPEIVIYIRSLFSIYTPVCLLGPLMLLLFFSYSVRIFLLGVSFVH
jgi:hypothetical protein